MSFSFRPAVRSGVNLLIGLAGGTGSGKTFTAMRLASGMSGDKPFCVIDTESGRASHYADRFKFDVGELRPPFTPARYREAIEAAVAVGYEIIVIDSMSHEYAGDGGVLDMQEVEFSNMGYKDSAKVASWIKPKGEHKRMMQYLLQVRAHLILCFRAEPKIEMVNEKTTLLSKLKGYQAELDDARPSEREEWEKVIAETRAQLNNADGKTRIVPKRSSIGHDGWIPITEKNLSFELTISLMFTADAPGMPKPIKLQEQHKALFPLDQAVTEESGRRIAQWAAGGVVTSRTEGVEYVTDSQVADLETMLKDGKIEIARMLAKANVDKLSNIRKDEYARAITWVKAVVEKARS